jgi:hypothetical protein
MRVSTLLIRELLTKRTNGMVKRPVAVALATVLTAVVTVLGTTPQASAQTGDGTSVSTNEMNCYEINIPRPADLLELKAAVPETYKSKLLVTKVSGQDAGLLWFIDYGCKQLAVDDQTPPQRMTASFVAAALQPPAGLYILYHATNSKELADAYSELQSKYQPETTSSYKAGEPVHARWDIRGNGLTHTIDAETTEPEESPITTDTGLFCYQTDSGQQLQLTYNNSTRPRVNASIRADFRQATNLTDLFFDDSFLTIPRNGAPGRITMPQAFLLGSWTSTLQETSNNSCTTS